MIFFVGGGGEREPHYVVQAGLKLKIFLPSSQELVLQACIITPDLNDFFSVVNFLFSPSFP
jgi:hypothetical protein